MERPYVICHILSSLDGKIAGPFMRTEAAGALGTEYGKYRAGMNADAWLYGITTTKEFTNFRRPVLERGDEVPEGDFIADDRAELYYISVDVGGEIGWESGIFRNKGRAPAHVVEVLTASTPAAYKAYLRKTGVSYIIAGEERLDCGAASLFTQIPSLAEGEPVEFLLKEVEKTGDGGLRLNYQAKNRRTKSNIPHRIV